MLNFKDIFNKHLYIRGIVYIFLIQFLNSHSLIYGGQSSDHEASREAGGLGDIDVRDLDAEVVGPGRKVVPDGLEGFAGRAPGGIAGYKQTKSIYTLKK